MANDKETEKKAKEEEALFLFLELYNDITGNNLELLESYERPDFICVLQNGNLVGVELTKVRRSHPNDILFDKINKKQHFMSPDQALDKIQQLIISKDKARNNPDWKFSEATILILELVDIPLANIKHFLSEVFIPEISLNGFEEIWLVDFSEIQAYGSIEMFCLRSYTWKGYYSRGMQKPYN